MTRVEAVNVLRQVSRLERQTRPDEFRRLLRAFTALGLTVDEQRSAGQTLDFVDERGRPLNDDCVTLAPWSIG